MMRLWCFYLVVLFASFSAGSSDAGLEQSLADANKRMMFALQKGSEKASLQDMFAQLELNLVLVDQLLPILASQPDPSSAIAVKAKIFSELCFKYAVELSGKEFPENLPAYLACSYAILFSGTIRLKQENVGNYFLVMHHFGKAILTSRPDLDRCINWVVLLTQPEMSNVPSFLSSPRLMPEDAYAHFWSSYIACFCGKGFTYQGMRRIYTGQLPFDTILILLAVSTEDNAVTNKPFMNQDMLTSFMMAVHASSKRELMFGSVAYGPDAIKSLTKLILTYKANNFLIELLITFALSYDMGGILLTTYQRGFEADVEDLMDAIGVVTHASRKRREVVHRVVEKMNKGEIYNFICTLVNVSVSILTIEATFKEFLQSLSCGTRAQCGLSSMLAVQIGIAPRYMIVASQPGSKIKPSTREKWTASLLKNLNLDQLDQMDFERKLNFELLGEPDVMQLFYWLCKIIPGNDHCISKLLLVAVASCYKLNADTTTDDIERVFQECESTVLSEACRSASDYGLIGGPEVLDSFVIISRLTRVGESSLERDIRNSVLGYLELALFEYNAPNRAFNVASILDRLPVHFDDSQVQSIHLQLRQSLVDLFHEDSSNLNKFYTSGNFKVYIRYLETKYLVPASTILMLRQMHGSLVAELKAPGRR